MKNLLVIGGSDAGISAALRARELDAAVDIQVLVADRFPSFSICGIPYFLSGEVSSSEDLAHRTRAEIEARRIRLLLEHEAERFDPAQKSVRARSPTGETLQLAYDRLVLATGAKPVHPPLSGMDLPGVFPLRRMGDALAVDRFMEEREVRRAVIVGGGYLGLEMAESLTRCGIAVTLVENAPTVLGTLDPDLGERVAAELARNGVEVLTSTMVEAIAPIEGHALGVLATGNVGRPAQLVLVAVGAAPETGLAREAGLATGIKGAIKVDRHMRTSDADVFAAGDCVETWHRVIGDCGYLPLGTTAHKQGRIAGENAVGADRQYAGSLGTQVVRVFELVAARTGLNDADARAAGLESVSAEAESWDHKVYYPGASKLRVRITGERTTGRLLGAQILGRYGAEVSKRIDILATALYQGMSVADVIDLDLSYAPPLSNPWDPVQTAAQAWQAERDRRAAAA